MAEMYHRYSADGAHIEPRRPVPALRCRATEGHRFYGFVRERPFMSQPPLSVSVRSDRHR